MKNKKDVLKNKMHQTNYLSTDIVQFRSETETWKQLLNERMEENVLLKNSLADILKNNFDKNSLEDIEDFQNQFIKEDELINLLKKDVNELDKIFKEGSKEESLKIKIGQFRRAMCNSLNRFVILKSAFNDFQQKISGKRST